MYLYLYMYFSCLGVCRFVSNKRQNGIADRAQILCVTSHDPMEGLWNIKIENLRKKSFKIVVYFPPKFDNGLKWPIFRTTVKRFLH